MFPLKKKPAIPATTPPATAPPATAPTASYASVAASVADPPPAQTAEPVGEEAPDLIGGVPSSQIPTGYQQAIHRAAAGGGKFEKVRPDTRASSPYQARPGTYGLAHAANWRLWTGCRQTQALLHQVRTRSPPLLLPSQSNTLVGSGRARAQFIRVPGILKIGHRSSASWPSA
jgi:hypothetical protein